MSDGWATTGTGAQVREERCAVLYAHVADGVSAQQGFAMRDAMNDADTIGWWFLNPGTFVAIFASANDGLRRATACETALEHLAAQHPSWPWVTTGVSEGPLLGAFTEAGILESMPVGAAISAAMRHAMSKDSAPPL